jgi:hypothetical protein
MLAALLWAHSKISCKMVARAFARFDLKCDFTYLFGEDLEPDEVCLWMNW